MTIILSAYHLQSNLQSQQQPLCWLCFCYALYFTCH